MKKTVLLSLLLPIFFAGTAQINEREATDWQPIGRLHFGGITKASMEYKANEQDTTYLLFVKDVREVPKNNYFTIKFKNTNGTYEKLYTILKSFFLPEYKKDKKYSRTFDLGNTGVNVQHYRLITGRGIMFYTQSGYTYWSEYDIDKLFGKR